MAKHLNKIKQVCDTWRVDRMWPEAKGNRKYLCALLDDAIILIAVLLIAKFLEKYLGVDPFGIEEESCLGQWSFGALCKERKDIGRRMDQ